MAALLWTILGLAGVAIGVYVGTKVFTSWGRFWSVFFLTVPIWGVGLFVVAAMPNSPLYNHWLPLNINDAGAVIDNLFMFILYLTGVIFVGTSLALFWFLWKYDAEQNPEPVKFIHGSHSLEIVWSILPAATLLFIAIYQMDAWAEAKMRRPIRDPGLDQVSYTADDVYEPPMAEVVGRQFEWRIRYPGDDGVLGTFDDILDVNELHIPVDEEIVLRIKSEDVLHSFFLPNVRIKQDVVPGMQQFVWFKANRRGKYDIVCAELCGWGHYKMRGRLIVESRKKYEAWLEQKKADQNATQVESADEGDDS